ncbi:hypothetical protein [uncultured Sphingomonas sp.]|uniref:hypothetical protein n=1 Tax=uncultured Sphingomonas sp. TaxID=158754 RepID=UPI0035CB625E
MRSMIRTAALGLVVSCQPALAQEGERPASPVADPAATRSDEPAPPAPAADPIAAPLADGAPAQTQTPLAGAAPAATGAADGRLTYDAAFFRAFSPANALQIVERTPGFQLEIGDEEVRGFGGAAGNVVIDGQRPSSKSDTLDTILQRIPASRVARVEIGRGDLFGAEFAGRPQVLNLVLAPGGGLAGTAEATVRRDYTGKLFPQGSASALVRRGRSSLNLAAAFENDSTSEQGYDRVTRLSDGRELEFRRKVNRIANPNGYVSGAFEFNGGANDTAHLNARVARDRFDLRQRNAVTLFAGPARDDRLTQSYDLDSYELGGDYTKPFAGGAVKLVGLAVRKRRDNQDESFLRVQGDMIGGFTQSRADSRDETVVRVVWNRSDLGGWSVETGVEGALNTLDSAVDLFGLAAGGAATRIDLPVDRAVVEEYRGEAFVNAGRPITGKLRVDLGVTFEASELTVSGDASANRTLRFVKPRATLDWRFGEGWHAQASLKRTVAQLQFEDFISVAELSNERVNGGNAELLPQRAWEALAFVERPILGDGLIRLEAGYNRISLVQDRVPTPEGFDAPGNLGNGELFLLRGRIDAPLTRFGIKGGRATFYASYVGTRVEDPYTGEGRAFSGTSPLVITGSFRQDGRKFAWGFDIEGAAPSTFFRQNELDRNFVRTPYVSAFAEYRPTPRTTVTAGLENATGRPAFRSRTFFQPDRKTPDPSVLEFRRRNQHVIPYLTVKHSFG